MNFHLKPTQLHALAIFALMGCLSVTADDVAFFNAGFTEVGFTEAGFTEAGAGSAELGDTGSVEDGSVEARTVGARLARARSPRVGPLEQLSFLLAVDGAKQPQDFGVNADLGVRLRTQYAAPLMEEYGLGYQVGTALTWTDNAVRVFELLGEDTTRFQNYVTLGLFQRVGRFGWGAVFDHLYQDGFDNSSLGQVRGRVTYNATKSTQIGGSIRVRAFDDTAVFNGDEVTLRSINQGSFFLRHFYETGVQFTLWAGLVEEHGESNAAFGNVPGRRNSLVIGSDFYAPLNNSLALFGETNLITPADTGTVDAYFGMIWYPFGNARKAFRRKFAPMFNVGAPTSVSVDLIP